MLKYEQIPEEDIGILYELYRKSVLGNEDPTVVDLQEVLRNLQQSICSRKERILRASDERGTVGYCSMQKVVDGTVLLEDLVVLPQYRRQTLGTQLLQHCLGEADGPVYRYVYIRSRNEISFYEKNGFITSRMVSPTREVMIYRPQRKRKSI